MELLPADEQEVLLYHSTQQSIVKRIRSHDIQLISPYSVIITLGSFAREFNTEYKLVIKSLIANHGDHFCMEKNLRIEDVYFITSGRPGEYSFWRSYLE